MAKLKSWIPLVIIGILIIIAYVSGLTKYLTFDWLRMHEQAIAQFISEHPLLSPVLFTSIYTLSIVLLLPVGVFLSLAGGFFFFHPLAEIYILIGTTAGACIVYLAAKGALRPLFQRKAGRHLKKMEREFKAHDVNYLLFLRLLPFSPFWLVNLSCAFFGVRFWTFTWTTFAGNIPSTIIFVDMGTELGKILRSGEEISAATFFSLHRTLLLIALALFILIPILIKKFQKN